MQSKHQVALAANHVVHGELTDESFKNAHRRITYNAVMAGKQGEVARLDKLATIYTTRDRDLPPATNVLHRTLAESTREARRSLEEHLAEHKAVWAERWEMADVELGAQDDFDQLAVRFSIFHLIQMTAWNDPTVSVAAKGCLVKDTKVTFLGYEIFIMPFSYIPSQMWQGPLILPLPYSAWSPKECQRKRLFRCICLGKCGYGRRNHPEVGGIDPVTRKPIPILCGKQEHHISVDVRTGLELLPGNRRPSSFSMKARNSAAHSALLGKQGNL